MSINKAILIGNVGSDLELRATQDGKEIATLSIATSETWKDKSTGEKKEKTEWHRVVVFSQGLVGVIKNYIKKGSKLYIEGQLQTRKWTDKQGIEKYTTEIVLQNYKSSLIMLDSRNNQGGSNDYGASSHDNNTQYSNEPFTEEVDDDVPF